MVLRLEDIARFFDARASVYGQGNWHRRSAERLIELCELHPGDRVLDAGTGTGFAAFAAARVVGVRGHVIGVDISSEMLRGARASLADSGLTNLDFMQADATALTQCESETFDAVTSATSLLYMNVGPALREWHRLLKEGGIIGFSTIAAGSPPGGRLFRECAAAFGVMLKDPCEPLGTPSASRMALERASIEVVTIVAEVITFSAEDLANAWQSNYRSPAHADVRRLSADDQLAMERKYLDALAAAERHDPGSLARADMLYVIGRRGRDRA